MPHPDVKLVFTSARPNSVNDRNIQWINIALAMEKANSEILVGFRCLDCHEVRRVQGYCSIVNLYRSSDTIYTCVVSLHIMSMNLLG